MSPFYKATTATTTSTNARQPKQAIMYATYNTLLYSQQPQQPQQSQYFQQQINQSQNGAQNAYIPVQNQAPLFTSPQQNVIFQPNVQYPQPQAQQNLNYIYQQQPPQTQSQVGINFSSGVPFQSQGVQNPAYIQNMPQQPLTNSNNLSMSYDPPPSLSESDVGPPKKKKLRIRPICNNPDVVIPDLLVSRSEIKDSKDILTSVKKHLDKFSISMFTKPLIKYSPKGKCNYEEVPSDDVLMWYIEKSEKPVICVCEQPTENSFLDLEGIINVIRKQHVRNDALSMMKDKKSSNTVMEVLRSEKMTKKLTEFVEEIKRGVDRVNGNGPIEIKRGEDSDSSDSSSDDDNDESESLESLYGSIIGRNVGRVMEATMNTLDRDDAYKLLKKNDFDVKRALDDYFDS